MQPVVISGVSLLQTGNAAWHWRMGDTWAPLRMGQKQESSKEPVELGVFVMNIFGGVSRNRVWVFHPATLAENTQDPSVDR